ncbi:proline--tRNA ligase [Candidatus Micrarchaeota archaeon]|nr:proline--tRNA ligase [Candidatus Micrarchaeota archaeon]MBU1930288.1 proline--tRNA ligase [Candidatus Micrarchaeota archaeon]
MAAEKNSKFEKVTFDIDKNNNFSEWFTEIIKRAELADLRYNVKGFLVFQPWSVIVMEKMYSLLEVNLQKKGHNPYWYPVVIPEKNFLVEKDHVEGFAPEVFWVTEHGAGEKLEEKLALRPTSETAFYQMFAWWIRSYNDLPLKTYQRGAVYRYETKATRPFLRSREFHWIEAHNAFATHEEALQQVKEDMQITQEFMGEQLGIPTIFFQRPQWDKFPGALNTFAADSLMPDGKTIQQPSSHDLGQNFSKAFKVLFTDKDGKEKHPFITCYGPAISRIFASLIAIHGDNNGLRFPFEVAPKQIVIVPIAVQKEKKLIPFVKKLALELQEAGYRVELDLSDRKPGDKFYFWEMKGVPLRIEVGPKELQQKKLTLFRRDTKKKEVIAQKELLKWIPKTGKALSENLKKQASHLFDGAIKNADSFEELARLVNTRGFVKCNFCADGKEGEECAEKVEKELAADIRGKRADKKESPFGSQKCVVCGKPSKEVFYIAKQY